MPRLLDLLPEDNTKKGLIAEAKKGAARFGSSRPDKKNPPRGDNHQHGKKSAPHDDSGQNRPREHRQPDRDRHGKPAQPVAAIVPDFVALDVETTGLDFKHDRVIEVGAVRFVNGKPEAEFSTFVNAGVPIPDHISRLTHITDDDIRPAPSFGDVAMRLLEFIGSLPICGHQTEFDLTFVNAELKRALLPDISPQIIDTALMSRILLQRVGRYSLKHACSALNVTLNNAHRALHDAKASGELAVRLIPELNDLPLEVRQALAAFAPGSMFKTLAIKSLGGARYGVNLKSGEPLEDKQLKIDTPEQYLKVDAEQIERVFSDNVKASGVINGFCARPAQKEMALRVTRALNDGRILAAEAGTGTGKSLAYLVPAAAHALKNNCRVIVSTHTRNLQDQLITKDLPAAAALCGGELRYTKLKGRNNYLCRARFYKLLRGEIGSLSPRERNAVLPLIVWSQATESGDIEEQTFFNPKWFFKAWNLISAESLECAGRKCAYHTTCFLQKARQLAQTSHIVVINHALFYSDVCSETSFLGAIGSIVFDEAHHLESSGHQHLRTEFDTNRATAFIDRLQNLLHAASAHKGLVNTAEFEKDLKNHLKHIRKRSNDLLSELDKWALSAEPKSEAEYQIAVNEGSLRGLLEPAVFDITLGELQDAFHEFRQAISAARDKESVDGLRDEVTACAEQASQLRADLQYLTAARTDEHVFWIEGNHEKKWVKLCGVPLDISELLSQIWSRSSGGIVFTSATLATQGSTGYFNRAVGLERFADRTESVILPSPYGAGQTLFCAFRHCPEPDHPNFARFAADAIAAVHSNFGKNILVLFTSNAMLSNVYGHLKSRPDVDRNNLLAQGYAGNRNSMLEEFKTQSAMILLGTDSFWEGVDAPGAACEAVVIPRLPFPVPSHPLTQAMGKRMEKIHGNSFFSYSVPEAVIKFRQGIGRLIRSAEDRGALVVLDNRIITKGYGKQFSAAVGSAVNEFSGASADDWSFGIDGMVGKMREFFTPIEAEGAQASGVGDSREGAGDAGDVDNVDDVDVNDGGINDAGDDAPESTITYVPFEDL
ncbi:MAG: DEAD/DEAH box helicase family protein [Chitinispirillales bacterium]|jgi:predicted DnaQ family exonuclease/DinG family helicase|nr:DEAD/DEAH box helicase family protein [Chitinispirillales bacterium]